MPTDRPHKLPVSVLVVIHTAEGEVLLLERADRPGWWQSVTGSCDAPDEPLRTTARREVEEETGIVVGPGGLGEDCLSDWHTVNRYEIFAHWRHRYAPGVTHNTEHVYGMRVPRDMPVRLSTREHTACAWLPWQAAAQRCFSPSNAAACRLLGERLDLGMASAVSAATGAAATGATAATVATAAPTRLAGTSAARGERW